VAILQGNLLRGNFLFIGRKLLMGKTPRMKPKRLPEKLRQIRERLGLSQNGLIRQMGFEEVLVQASISGYESGTREPPLPVLLQYSEISGVWVNSIIDDDVDMPEKLPANPKSEGIKRTGSKKVAKAKRGRCLQ
jgi:transcriptional regulator with XRE-family HTH domain